jgi:hypothetical protein
MPDDHNDNLLRLPTRQPFTPEEMSAWFHHLANHLGKDLDIEPTAFLLVLLNDEHIRVYTSGRHGILDEAASAAQDYRHYRQDQTFYDDPETARAKRRQWKQQRDDERAAHEQAFPYTCDACHRRYKTEHTYRRHQAKCWTEPVSIYCEACEQGYPTFTAWRAHACTSIAQPNDAAAAMHIIKLELR